jgi:XTP/dITP diphosphohydrolase
MDKASAKPPRLIYLASNNAHKAQELTAMAQGRFDVRLAKELDPHVQWDESGATCLENARIKAKVVKKLTDAAVLADDSGLEVHALGGAPGVYSSRYAGREGDDSANNAKLLQELRAVPDKDRMARFVCILYFIDEHGQESFYEGACDGSILTAKRGHAGFGYDPLFLVQGLGKSMAELSPEEKNAVSHRRRAFDSFLKAGT